MKDPVRISFCRYLIFIALFSFSACYEEAPFAEVQSPFSVEKILAFDGVSGMVDTVDHMIMFTMNEGFLSSYKPEIQIYGYQSVRFKDTELIQGQVNELGPIAMNQSYNMIARTSEKIDTFNVLFTTLPLMHIKTADSIVDAYKVHSHIELNYYDPDDRQRSFQNYETYAGIEIRGRSSTRYEKKSYGFELWEEGSTNDYISALLGMRAGEDWILDAMFIDNLRMRNKISFELWEKISNIPSEDQKRTLFPGIRCRFVELFINNRYSGLYCLDEKLDERLLQFAKNQHEKGGVLYKAIDWGNGSTGFEVYNSNPPDHFLWDGWEIIFPEHEYNWGPLAEFRKFVVQSDDAIFRDGIGKLIDLDNAIDYYLLINLLLAYDNTGKNTYLAKYSAQSKFFIMPWDMEATWGRMWDGTNSNVWGILGNHLFSRLIFTDAEDFNKRVKNRWKEYRQSVFHQDSLMDVIDKNFARLKNSGAMERENARWNEIEINPDNEYSYIETWLTSRLEVLDDYFDQNSELK